MRIQNLKSPAEPVVAPVDLAAAVMRAPVDTADVRHEAEPSSLAERQALELSLLRARIQHLELVVETARSLMGSNQERLLRRLHEVPREMAALGAQLRRLDPEGSW